MSVDIHELDGDVAVDEIVLHAPEDWEPARLGDALARTGAGTLLSSQRATDVRDPIVSALQWCAAMIAAGPHGSDLELGRAVLDVTHADAAWALATEDALDLAAGALALERGGAVVVRTDELPAAYAGIAAGPVWVLAAPDGALAPSLVVFATRPLRLRFTPADVARVEMLLRVHRGLSAGCGAPAPVAAGEGPARRAAASS